MAAFILKRLLWTVPVLLVVVTITFFMLRAIGGSPFRHGPLLGFGHPAWVKYGDQQPESIEYNMAHRYGLDLPWYRQYANYLRGLVTFDLGPSLSYRNRTVNEIVREQARPSLEVGALAFLLALGIGIPVGLLAALRAGTTFDYAARLLSGVGVDVPSFLPPPC